MRIRLDVELTTDRITAKLPDGSVLFDDSGVMWIEPGPKCRYLLSGIGTDTGSVGQGGKAMPVVSRDSFQPSLAAAVAAYVAVKSWVDLRGLRHWWKALLALFDRVDVWITIDGYELTRGEDRRAFENALPYRPQFHWWLEGEKVKQ